MKIKIWGVRGSVPVSGKEYIKYGGNTTCLEIRDIKNNLLIVDAGTGIRELGEKIVKEGVREIKIIFTHQHLDHIVGFPFFKPIYDSRNKIVVSGFSFRKSDIKKIFNKIMKPPLFPVKFEEVDSKFEFKCIKKDGCMFNTINVIPIELNHPNGALGYKFIENGKILVFLTDNELFYRYRKGRKFEDYVKFSKNADILIADADYTDEEYSAKKGWGHSTYSQALELAVRAEVKTLCLFHHNQNRTDKDIDRIVDTCRKKIKKTGADIECVAAYEGQVFDL